MKKEETIEQIDNIVQSLIRNYEKKLLEQKIDTAVKINHLLKQAKKNQWGDKYVNALKDVKKVLNITNFHDLFV